MEWVYFAIKEKLNKSFYHGDLFVFVYLLFVQKVGDPLTYLFFSLMIPFSRGTIFVSVFFAFWLDFFWISSFQLS